MFLKILGEGEIARLPPLVAGLTDANAVCQWNQTASSFCRPVW